MPSLESEAQAARRQLERVLESPGFSRNERLSRFLRFVVEGHLDSKDDELKESVIAIEVFGRRPDFDSRLDPVVRTEAARLRASSPSRNHVIAPASEQPSSRTLNVLNNHATLL